MSMRGAQHNLGPVDWIGAEAVGVPGQRRFRLMIASNGNYAHLWLEKEQLQALADAVARMLLEIDAASGSDLVRNSEASPLPKPASFPTTANIDFQVGALGLRYDPEGRYIGLEVSEREAEETDPPMLRCQATRHQVDALRANSLEVIAAGRPKCPLCGTPLSAPGMPHFCPPTNGHQKLTDEDE